MLQTTDRRPWTTGLFGWMDGWMDGCFDCRPWWACPAPQWPRVWGHLVQDFLRVALRCVAMASRPGVGVGCFVTCSRYPGCVLLGKRKNKTGLGTWALPGGHVESCESFEETAAREVKEETGLELSNIRTVAFVNCYRQELNYHYVIPLVVAEYAGDEEPVNTEPHKCEGWEWVEWGLQGDAFPCTPLFYGLQDIRAAGFSPFETKATPNTRSKHPQCYFVAR